MENGRTANRLFGASEYGGAHGKRGLQRLDMHNALNRESRLTRPAFKIENTRNKKHRNHQTAMFNGLGEKI